MTQVPQHATWTTQLPTQATAQSSNNQLTVSGGNNTVTRGSVNWNELNSEGINSCRQNININTANQTSSQNQVKSKRKNMVTDLELL